MNSVTSLYLNEVDLISCFYVCTYVYIYIFGVFFEAREKKEENFVGEEKKKKITIEKINIRSFSSCSLMLVQMICITKTLKMKEN